MLQVSFWRQCRWRALGRDFFTWHFEKAVTKLDGVTRYALVIPWNIGRIVFYALALWGLGFVGVLYWKNYSLKIRWMVTQVQLEQSRHAIIQLQHQSDLLELGRKVAHDIRSPLAALKMSLRLLNVGKEEGELIFSSVKRIESIANDLLDSTRNTKAKVVLTGKAIDESLGSLVREKIAAWNALPSVIEYTVLDSHILLREFIIDQAKLLRAVSNLLNNAYEIHQESNVQTPIQVTLRASQSDDLMINIRDFGSGIPESVLIAVQANSSVSTKADGNGIGLSSALRDLRQMGGDLLIARQASPSGTLIQLQIPRYNGANRMSAQPQTTAHQG